MDQVFLTEVDAARYLAVSRRTLQAWRQKGGGPGYTKLGESVRYRLQTLNEWAASRTRHSTSDAA